MRRSARTSIIKAVSISLALIAGAAACSSSSSGSGGGSSGAAGNTNPLHLIDAGTLTVGMNLTSRPQMYVDSNGKPAGYDVLLLNRLASDLHLKLKIDNLAFDGLIPGLQAKKFDMVSSGLSNTPERRQVVDFSRAYVPYQIELAVPDNSTLPATVAAWNKSSVSIAGLQGSNDADIAKAQFPQAHMKLFPTVNDALLELATGRASAAVAESFLIKTFQDSNPGKIKPLEFDNSVLPTYYGAYAVQKGNSALTDAINQWICTNQGNGFMKQSYESTEHTTFPQMPAC